MMDSYFWRMSPFKRLVWLKFFAGGGSSSILKTVSGALIHITDALAKPLKKLVVNLEPVQSGSGDPSPENIRPITGHTGANVVRTGVNVWNEEWENGLISTSNGQNVNGTGIRSKNYCPCKPNTSYYFVADVKRGRYIFWYDKDKNFISAQNRDTGSSPTEIKTSPSNAAFFRIRADGITTYINNISVNCPSTDTDYHAYSGTTIPITSPVLGKNLLDMSDANIEVGKYIDNSGAEKTNGSNFYNTDYVPVKASTAYTLSTSASIKYCSFMEYDANKTFIKRTLYGNGSTPFTTQSHTMGDTTAFVLVGSNPTGSTIDLAAIKAINWMFNEGSTAETYEPYTSTVYGGTLDVTSGLLKVYPYYDSYNGETLTGHWISNMDKYEVGTTPTIGAQVVNDGATPITHQITPTEINLLQGENNIWCDASDNLELKYYATSG